MEFVESTSFFLRTIMFDFIVKDPKIKLQFRLVPMFHIGSASYYQEVEYVLKECDEILYEGLELKKLKWTFDSFKLIAKKLNLVTQSQSLSLKSLDIPLIHSDLDKENGNIAWRKLNIKEKLKLQFEDLILLFRCYSQLNRKMFLKVFMSAYAEPVHIYGPKEIDNDTQEYLIFAKREQVVFDIIEQKMKEEYMQEKKVAIIYGAGHMKSIARFLIDRYRFVPTNGRFLKVFNVED